MIMLMRMIVIVYDGYIAEGHVVLSTWSSVIDVCYTDAETIYLRNIHIHHRQHHLAGIALHHSALECPSHLGSRIWRPRPANSTQLYSNNYQHYLQYQPSLLHWLASMSPLANEWCCQFRCWWVGGRPSLHVAVRWYPSSPHMIRLF